jgi:hypothetical protein
MTNEPETHQHAIERVWSRVAKEHPEFTRAHDIFNNPWSVQHHVLDNEQGFVPFPGAKVLDLGANVGVCTAYWALNG